MLLERLDKMCVFSVGFMETPGRASPSSISSNAPVGAGGERQESLAALGTRAAGRLPSDGDQQGRARALAAPFFMQKRAINLYRPYHEGSGLA